MRILFVHPNYRSGGAEIAGNWPPAWVAYLTGSLRAAGFQDIHFIDAMTYHIGPDELRKRLAECSVPELGFALNYSAGMAVLTPQDDALAPLMARADTALYAAKAAGRGQLLAAR